ncbi:hypothetical protein [Nocardia rhizosphaerae]|uniref:Uncharacterized protein n=1 Tax=Nocardia rhizosphaerae TaxID=1691571 RepID=A0ABV8LC82_9NOCA
MTMPRRYWIEFDIQHDSDARLWHGVGVTGFDVPDCLSMVAELFRIGPLPPVRRVTADISLAEPLPVNLGLGVPVWRGVWYPPVNLETGPTRSIDRRAAPSRYPAPVADLPGARGGANSRAEHTWWDEIPYIRGLRWPLMDSHSATYVGGFRLRVQQMRTAYGKDPTLGDMVRDALDFMIAWRPTPDDWFDPTGIRFADQRQLDEYLQAFRDFLFGDRAEPIDPPGRP